MIILFPLTYSTCNPKNTYKYQNCTHKSKT